MKLVKNQIIGEDIGFLDLKDKIEIPENITFNNSAGVYLIRLKILPNSTVFNNLGFISLIDVEKIPTGVIFNNSDLIYLNKDVDLSELNYKELLNLQTKFV